MRISEEQLEALRKAYVGKRVHVIIDDPFHPIDTWGTVKRIDDLGQFHGTWGGLAAIYGIDYISMED